MTKRETKVTYKENSSKEKRMSKTKKKANREKTVTIRRKGKMREGSKRGESLCYLTFLVAQYTVNL